MTAVGSGDIIDIHSVLGSSVADNGAVLVHLGDPRTGEGIDENVPFFQTPGFVSVFAAPDPGSSAGEVLVRKTGGTDWAFAGRDVRGLKIAGNLKTGDACAYAPTGAARTLYKSDGSVSAFTTDDNTDNGRSIFSRVDLTGFTRFCPWGKETFGEVGYHLLHASGARLDLGSLSAPGLPPSVNSYASLSAQSIRLEGALISLGTQTGGLPEPVAKATSLQAYHAGLEALLLSLAATIDAKLPPSGTATVAAVTAALTALAPLKVAMTSITTQTT